MLHTNAGPVRLVIGRLPHSKSLARLERAHYQLQSSLYFTESVDLTGATAFFSNGISEAEWNHAALIHTVSARATASLMQRVESLFESRGLPAAVEFRPDNAPGVLCKLLADRHYERQYRYAWLVPGHAVHIDSATRIGDVDIVPVTGTEDKVAFLGILRAAYPRSLDSGYEEAVFRSRLVENDVIHHLARIDGVEVAVASSIHGRVGDAQGVTGLYNLAVHPGWRRRGLGRKLTQFRVGEAQRFGHKVFLQVEDTAVENWQRRHGFRLLFRTEGWVRHGRRPIQRGWT